LAIAASGFPMLDALRRSLASLMREE